jgi:ATP-binding cassette subfamily F protein uup
VDKAQNLFVKELEWMRRQPKARTTNRNRVRMIFEIKEKHKVAVRKTRWNLKSTWNMGSKIIELHKSQKNSGCDHG